MRIIKDILKKKSLCINTIYGGANVAEAFTLMESKNLDFVIVMENDDFVGVLSESDYLHKIILTGKDPEQTMVREIMTQCIHTVSIEETILNCLRLMDTFRIRHLLVFDRFSFVGVVTLHDLMQASTVETDIFNIQEQEQKKYNLSRYRAVYNCIFFPV